MWEKDKKVIRAYRACMKNLFEELKSGEPVDFESSCVLEGAKVEKYVFAQIETYK